MASKSGEGTKPARVVQSVQNNPTSRFQTNRQTLQQQHHNAISNDPLTQTIMSDLYVNTSQQPTTWNDIAGLTAVKQSLQESAILPLIRPDLFTGLRKPQNILLWGPPGTGKTLLVRAVSYESQSSLFVCTASGITSKWHGEGEKLVRALFSVAKQKSPSIIFIDEMDALLSARKSDGEHEASRRFKTEFMVQMDGIVKDENSSNKHVLLLACTNCPWDVDSAVLRRFSRRIYVPLPSRSARLPLIEKLLQKAGKNTLTADEIAKLVKKTKGFSCADITSIASEAAFEPLRSLGSLNAIRGVNERDVRPISMSDFERTIAKATKSVSPELIKRYEEWNQQQSAS